MTSFYTNEFIYFVVGFLIVLLKLSPALLGAIMINWILKFFKKS